MYNPFDRQRSPSKKPALTPDLQKEHQEIMDKNITELVAQYTALKLSPQEVSDRLLFAEKELLSATDDDIRSVIHLELAALHHYQQSRNSMPKDHTPWKPSDGISGLADIPAIPNKVVDGKIINMESKYPIHGQPFIPDYPDAEKIIPTEPPAQKREDISDVYVPQAAGKNDKTNPGMRK